MGRTTPSQAKNAIRRALLGEIESALTPADRSAVWSFFENRCAYCDRRLDPGGREGHMDHLIPRSAGGLSTRSNTVLACRFCNGDEKRDEAWEPFLRRKAPSAEAFELRRDRVLRWVESENTPIAVLDESLRRIADESIRAATAAFDAALERVRRAKRSVQLLPPRR